MATFSASDAALEGFQVLRRSWRVTLGWALFYVVAAVAVAVASAIIGVVLVVTGAASEAAVQAVLGPVVALLWLLATPLVLTGGVYRLLLRPDDPGFLHLRVGADELRLLGVWAVLAAVIGAGGFATAFVAGSVSLAASRWAGVPAGLLCAVALWLVLGRLGLAQADAVAQRRLDLAAAWRVGRGKSWALVGMGLITACLLGMIAVVVWLALVLAGGAMTGFGDLGLSDADALSEHPGRFLFGALAELVLTPVFIILAHAPVAAAYRALSAEPA